jgi:DNA-binding response OmpR family regulator
MIALLVDDNPSVVRVVSRMLVHAGYDTTTSTDFRTGLAELKGASPDVFVVDVRLGEFNGLQLAITARRQRPEVRIVVISAWDDPTLRAQAEACTAAYLTKPFTFSELLNAINSDERELVH